MLIDIERFNSTVLKGLLSKKQKKELTERLSNETDDRKAFLKISSFIERNNMNKKMYILCFSKTFNETFVDEIDVLHFKQFCSAFNKVYESDYKENKALRKYARIALDNYKFFKKKYLTELVFNATKNCSNCPNGHQAARDIIDLCKYALKVTEYKEFHFVLAESIFNMCPCCYQPSNYKEVCIKHYEKALEFGLHYDKIYENLLEVYSCKIIRSKSDEYYEKCKKCLYRTLLKEQSSWNLSHMVEASIALNKVDDLCELIRKYKSILKSSMFYEILKFLIENNSEHSEEYLNNIKELKEHDRFYSDLSRVYNDLGMKKELKESINEILDNITKDTRSYDLMSPLEYIITNDLFDKEEMMNLLRIYSDFEDKAKKSKCMNKTMSLIIIQHMMELYPESTDKLNDMVIDIYNKKESIKNLLENRSEGSILHGDNIELLLKVKSFKMLVGVLKNHLDEEKMTELHDGISDYISGCGLIYTMDNTEKEDGEIDGKNKDLLTGYDSDYDDLEDDSYEDEEYLKSKEEGKKMAENIQKVLNEIKEIFNTC